MTLSLDESVFRRLVREEIHDHQTAQPEKSHTFQRAPWQSTCSDCGAENPNQRMPKWSCKGCGNVLPSTNLHELQRLKHCPQCNRSGDIAKELEEDQQEKVREQIDSGVGMLMCDGPDCGRER